MLFFFWVNSTSNQSNISGANRHSQSFLFLVFFCSWHEFALISDVSFLTITWLKALVERHDPIFSLLIYDAGVKLHIQLNFLFPSFVVSNILQIMQGLISKINHHIVFIWGTFFINFQICWCELMVIWVVDMVFGCWENRSTSWGKIQFGM